MSFHPQTPQSPSLCSPATSSEPTISTAASSMSIASTLPTPAHSVNGSSSQLDAIMADDLPNKRKRPADDQGDDREQKKAHTGDHRLAIHELHLDVGPKYLLCQTPHPQTVARTSQDLYEMFNLVDLAAELAREKPNGEKNALRKTYKGHIKRLGVAGHFDVQKKEAAPSDFMAMLQVPDLEWSVHQVKGREIGDGLSETTLSSLGRAMTMAKGPISRSVWDTSVLGDLAPSTAEAGKTSSAKPTAPNTPLASTPGGAAGARPTSQAMAGQDPARPRRNIKKRGYGDSSFEGYGDGFPDDDGGADTGYSTGEGEGGQKRRKKSQATSSPYPSAMRQPSYGPGMVGA